MRVDEAVATGELVGGPPAPAGAVATDDVGTWIVPVSPTAVPLLGRSEEPKPT